MGLFGERKAARETVATGPRPLTGDEAELYARAFASAPSGSEALVVAGWTSAEWALLLALTESLELAAGAIVIERGERDRNLYFVASGRVEVAVPSPDGMSLSPIARLGAGSVVGELAFFDGEGRSASVWVGEDAVLLRLSERSFEAFSAENPALARDLLFGLGRVLASRLRLTTSRRGR